MSRPFVPHVITNDSALGGSIIEKSLRFRHGVNWSLQRTFSSNYSTWTASLWFKRGRPGDYQYLFAFGGTGLALNTSEGYLYIYNGSIINSSARFRDHTGWYHVVMKQSLGTAYTYVNGVLTHNGVSGFNINSGQNCAIGRYPGDHEFDGYMADIHLVCGQALEPTSFGYTDSQTGIWRPKKYTGTYDDDEGFHLEFKDASSASALGTDTSGKGHNFSSSNFSVSTNVWHMNNSGSAHSDSSTDSPTNNFCTLNPIDKDSNISILTEGNLRLNTNSSGWCGLKGTMAVSSGKWYYEFKTSNNNIFCGWCSDDLDSTAGAPQDDNGLMSQGSLVFCDDGRYHLDTGGSGNRVSYSTSIGSDVLGCAIDLDNNTAQFYKNGSGQGVIDISSSKLATKFVHPYVIIYTSGGTYRMNFGQKAFAYTPPAGYKAWSSNNKMNLNTPIILKPQKHFDTLLYTATGNAMSITGLEFKPDLIWQKRRDSTGGSHFHYWFDSVRGGTKGIQSNTKGVEFTATSPNITFTSNGYDMRASTGGQGNASGGTYATWCWKAGGAAVSNSDGSITSQVSVNEEAGFSIVTWTGNGSDGATVGHGLGTKPDWIIIKKRDNNSGGNTGNWIVQHKSLSNGVNANTSTFTLTSYSSSAIYLNLSSSQSSYGFDNQVNGIGDTFVAYCWTEIPGYSKFGKYRGNGTAEGTYIFTGFKPAWVMIKKSTNAGGWTIWDNKRDSFNYGDRTLFPHTGDPEESGNQYERWDLLSDGFKLRANGRNVVDSEFYIYMAFAEQPGSNPYGTETNSR